MGQESDRNKPKAIAFGALTGEKSDQKFTENNSLCGRNRRKVRPKMDTRL